MPNTTIFWALALVLVVATLAALAIPLLRTRTRRAGPAVDDASAAIYRDQKRQLDEDLAAGAITAEEREAAEREIVARLGAELSTAPAPAAAAPGRAPWITAIVIVAIVPAVALVAYLALGNPQALDETAARHRMSDAEIVSMVERLAQRMKADPSDPQGWVLLGRSWSALQRYQESADAYAEAAKRLPGNADVLADWADALAMAQGRRLAGRPTEVINEALAANPLITVLAFAGGLWCLWAVLATFRPRWRRSLALSRGAVVACRWAAGALLAANWAYEVFARR